MYAMPGTDWLLKIVAPPSSSTANQLEFHAEYAGLDQHPPRPITFWDEPIN